MLKKVWENSVARHRYFWRIQDHRQGRHFRPPPSSPVNGRGVKTLQHICVGKRLLFNERGKQNDEWSGMAVGEEMANSIMISAVGSLPSTFYDLVFKWNSKLCQTPIRFSESGRILSKYCKCKVELRKKTLESRAYFGAVCYDIRRK